MMSAVRSLPVTYLVASVAVGVFVATLLLQNVISLRHVEISGTSGFVAIALVIVVPLLLMGLLQVALYSWLIVVLLRNMRKWRNTPIVIGALITPIFALLDFSQVSSLVKDNTANQPRAGFPVGLFTTFVLSFVAMGAVAYNDIKYRKQYALMANGVTR